MPRQTTIKTTRLLTHTLVARMFSMTPKTLRYRVSRGLFPLPHSTERTRPNSDVGLVLYYSKELIDHRIETGFWPACVRFRGDSDVEQDLGSQPAPSE